MASSKTNGKTSSVANGHAKARSLSSSRPGRRRDSIDVIDANVALDLATHQTYDENVFLFVPNLIGYTRIIIAGVALNYMKTHPRFCSLLYGISCLLDAFDGMAARALGQTSKFGAVLDMVTDRSLVTGSRSHKLVTSQVSRILWYYYNDPNTLFLFCAGNELFYVFLYLMHFEKTPIGEPFFGLSSLFIMHVMPYVPAAVLAPKTIADFALALSQLTWPQLGAVICAPVCLAKNIVNFVQLWKASKILVGVDLAERAKDRAVLEMREE
ncbi:CDP-diacylglycerol-inositol 3-phosphatidyltransferase [Tulasnella sp. 330]|nr:CDP-diacylglycerol-inositol 3-phosphatidyltransferase [Tulasnella sp. 330]